MTASQILRGVYPEYYRRAQDDSTDCHSEESFISFRINSATKNLNNNSYINHAENRDHKNQSGKSRQKSD